MGAGPQWNHPSEHLSIEHHRSQRMEDRSTECCYTPGLVRWWLDRYPALQAASEGACGLGNLRESGGGLREVRLYPMLIRPGVDPEVDPRYYQLRSRTNRLNDLATTALCIKCDLDRAIKQALNPRERQVVIWRWCQEHTVREIAAKLRISHQRVVKICDGGVAKIARNLGYTPQREHGTRHDRTDAGSDA